ncbi:hypothetical protein ACFSQD_14450 [Flavihumibacter stibioxidans]|uniref:hypothetical protein n=1 Tax=Flavihumibacter stibioxidans TaxID=1834163 RepID=UPI001650AA90|nr:hypothetical protein [Flavihumibacter stibioxidans]
MVLLKQTESFRVSVKSFRLLHLSLKTITMPTPLKPAVIGGIILAAVALTAFLKNQSVFIEKVLAKHPVPRLSSRPPVPENPAESPTVKEPATPAQDDPEGSIWTASLKNPVSSETPAANQTPNAFASSASKTKIQVAVLLDVSNSMDGLIEQAKAQLWNMVSVLGKARCDGATPQIEIALYEYGRSSNNARLGYVEQVNGFTRDLDQVSKNLFRLTTNGGDEYCGQVMYTSLSDLQWDAGKDLYKVIFIAGNEDFLQGSVPFTKACNIAKQKGVIVNTIYCGDRLQGIREHWNLGAECGNGSFTYINSNAVIDDIATPYDDQLFKLNQQLNDTYISYGAKGEESKSKQMEADVMNYSMNKSVAAKRVAVKGKKELYRNDNWDLVDAQEADQGFASKVDMKTLPEPLRNKSRAELKQYIQNVSAERNKIQKEIGSLNLKRESFISAERSRKAGAKEQTLETEVEKILREQAKRFRMVIE